MELDKNEIKQNTNTKLNNDNQDNQDNLNKLNINTIGVHSTRYSSLIILNEDTIIFPLGGKIQKYSYLKKAVTQSVFISHSVIMSIVKHKDFLIVMSYNGLINILDLDFKLVTTIQKLDEIDMVTHLCVNSDMSLIAVSTDYYFNKEKVKDTEGALVIFRNIGSSGNIGNKEGSIALSFSPIKIIEMY